MPAVSTWLVLALLFVAAPAAASEPDCPYDQDDQRRVVRELAARHPGGRLEEQERRITWPLASGESIVFVYGGCADLGSIVTRTEARATALPRDRVFTIALDLATKYWETAEAEHLKAGLATRAFQTEVIDGRTYYHVRHEVLSQLYVEYEFTDGKSRVTIAWSRNF